MSKADFRTFYRDAHAVTCPRVTARRRHNSFVRVATTCKRPCSPERRIRNGSGASMTWSPAGRRSSPTRPRRSSSTWARAFRPASRINGEWSSGVMEQWNNGTMEQWSNGWGGRYSSTVFGAFLNARLEGVRKRFPVVA